MSSITPPTDEYHVTWSMHLILGVGMLFPWNAFITAIDYFGARYPGRHPDRLFSICYLPSQFLTLIAMLYFHHKMNTRLRILWGYGGFCIAMLAVPLLEAVVGGDMAFGGVLLFVVATGIFDGIAQGALYGEAALLPPAYTQAIVAGTAVSGTAVSLLRIVTKAALPNNVEGLQTSAYLYFTVAAVVCLLCLLTYGCVLPRQPIVIYARQQAALRSSHGKLLDPGGHILQDGQEVELAGSLRSSTDFAESGGLMEEEAEEEEEPISTGAHHALLARVVKHAWRINVSLVVIYTITLAIFPGFLAEDIHSSELGDWYPIILIAIYNTGDLAGKVLPPVASMVENPKGNLLLACCLLRVLFVPAFHLSAKQGLGSVVIGALTLVLGVSNGYLTAVAMMTAPSGLEHKEAEMAGNMSLFALIGGLCVGAAASFLWLL